MLHRFPGEVALKVVIF